MKPLLFLLFAALLTAATPGRNGVTVRGKSVDVYYLPASGKLGTRPPQVLFVPGDGGWRGLAVTIGETMASWGYDVYGVDTKQYLTAFTDPEPTLSEKQVGSDLRRIAAWMGGEKITYLGWSQGAAMGPLAVAGEGAQRFRSLIAFGLPESGVLGWKFKDNFAILMRREPDEPHFQTAPLMASIAPVPLLVIQGDQDEYTAIDKVRALMDKAKEPKQLVVVPGADHRFDGHRNEFFTALQNGLKGS